MIDNKAKHILPSFLGFHKSRTLIILAVFTTVCIAANPAVRIKCSGRVLVDANDNEVMLRGIYSRAAWLLDGGGQQDIVNLRNWGCNFMRITVPFDSDYWNTVNGGVFDINKRGILREQDLQGMDQIAQWCEDNQMYFMLCQQPTYQGFDFDLLQYSPTDPVLYSQQMADVAATFAQRYKDYDYLLGYEPFGEPHGIDTSQERAAYKQVCTDYVDAIRAIDPNRIVSIAGCDDYANPGSIVDGIRVDRENIIYTFSYYPCRPFVSYQSWYGDIRYPDYVPDFYRKKVIWLDSDWLWTYSTYDYGMDEAVTASQNWNVPVYCHEFGAWGYGQWDGSSPDESSRRYMQDMVQLFEDNYINWIIWRWQTNADGVPYWWKDLWQGQQNNRAVIEPHGGEFVGSETVTIHTFVDDANIYYTTDGSEPDEGATLYTGSFSLSSNTTVKAKVIKAGLEGSPVDTAVFEGAGDSASILGNPVSGLRYWYYQGEWNTVPNFDLLQADSTGYCTSISKYQGSSSDGKALLWKGYINVPEGEIYYFNSRVDAAGGMKMHIGDEQIIINGSNTGLNTTYSVGQIALEAGMHPITLGYTWPTGASSLFEIEIQRPSDAQFVNIPSSMLYRDHSAPVQASNPSPADDQNDVPINRDIRWTAGVDTVSHDFYFGTTNPPAFIGEQSGAAYDPGVMIPEETYYWRADEKNNYGTTTGNIWSFTTGTQPCMIGWWKFDESYGLVADDSSDSGNHSQLMNMDNSAWRAGRNGNALHFDGYDDYVWIPYDATLDLGTGDFSVSLWAKKDSTGTGNTYLYNQRKDGYNWFYIHWLNDNRIKSALKVDGIQQVTITGGVTLSADTWYHIVMVVDRDSPSNSGIYINGEKDIYGSASVSTVDFSLGAGACIGRWSGGNGENFDGMIDDFRFFSWVLDESEIVELYDYGFIQGDIDKDDEVDAIDFTTFASKWDRADCDSPDWCDGADIDKNSSVNETDLMILGENWLKTLK